MNTKRNKRHRAKAQSLRSAQRREEVISEWGNECMGLRSPHSGDSPAQTWGIKKHEIENVVLDSSDKLHRIGEMI